MIRRTYKSKKDAGGGLDHREMVFNMDEKSSVFDAFYIQNIKQTKKEQSCMGSSNQHGVAGKKIRKRKYVKRIIKETEPPPKESLSGSVFLTPDKSIRVNKAQDLFDQLFNSSPAWAESKEFKRENLFDQFTAASPKEIRIYKRRKAAVKKFHYSSNESSESGKENTTQNETDIRSHELIIEKEAKCSPQVDKSINKVVQKLSLLNRNRNSCSEGLRKTIKYNNNRLTTNIQTPTSTTSPLSSTPFTDKQRKQSIYKFSPIPMGTLEDSPNYITILEEDNEVNKSIVFIPKNNSNTLRRSRDDNSSPLTHFNDEKVKTKDNSTSLFSSNADTHDKLTTKDAKVDENIIENEIKANVNTALTENETALEISEVEPFLGFANEVAEQIDNLVLDEDKDKGDSIIISTGKSSKGSQKFRELSKESQKTEDSTNEELIKNDDSTSTIEHSTSNQPLLVFAEQDNGENSFNVSVKEAVPDESMPDISKDESMIENDDVSDSEQTSLLSSSESENSVSSQFDVSTDETLYDTCSSAESTFEENVPREPVVMLERMSTSLINKYSVKNVTEPVVMLERMSTSLINKYCGEKVRDPVVVLDGMNDSLVAHYRDIQNTSYNEGSDLEEPSQDESLSDDYASFVTGNGSDETNSDDVSEYIHSEIDLISTEEEKSCQDTDSEDNTDTRQERESTCISFVTTRKRNDFTNDSTILVLDDSQDSISSEDFNKTVLSNRHSPKQEVNAVEIDENNTLISKNYEAEENLVQNACDESEIETDKRISLVTTRKSKIPRSSLHQNANVSMAPDSQGIVLHPGKKWERSLSIYRRMTMMNDHFDHTLIDDEDLQHKGRKYRQSVINTMEMQDHKGSLHNESINSCRSTFVPKPSRSTIRIVKETSNSRISLSSTAVFDDLKGFLEDCDDTIVELSKLSIADEHDVTVLDKFHDTKFNESRIATARDYVLRRCNQLDTLPFDECYPDSALKNCRKIGEGVYGEVYLWRAPDGRARVMKIVPIAGDIRVNGEQQKDFHEIIAEIVIAMELSALRAPIAEIECHFDEGKEIDAIDLHSVENATDVFNEVLGVKCVFGSYPSRLLDLWELYDESRGSENDTPAVLPPHQQYIVLELANAGQDLESYSFNSAEQAHALFLQVSFALAVGEEAFQFEHRDLHWGNVLIAPTDQKYATFVLRGRCHRVPRRGVAATIIDYSLSRISLPLGPTTPGDTGDSAALYNDLAPDDGLFSAVGDYQFHVYRLMRDKLGNDWKNFEPYTNILWLHYTVDKMITALRYKRTTTKTHKQYINKLKAIRSRLLDYGSAVQFVLTDNEFTN